MDLKTAIKSGKPFKRKKDQYWIAYAPKKLNKWFYYYTIDMKEILSCSGSVLEIPYKDLIAEDWEVFED